MDSHSHPVPQRILILAYPATPGALEQVEPLMTYLKDAGVPQVAGGSFLDKDLLERLQAKDFDLLIALGGDGTMLRAGHLCAPLGIPVLGINMGRVGFLTEIRKEEWQQGMDLLLQGRYRLEERMMLKAELWRGETSLGSWLVLNEVVVCRGRFVRPIRVQACVDGYTLTTYVADGVIAATPTGSTAYALAAGGPIMPPELRNILLIPVAPHLSMDRAIILSQGACVELRVQTDAEHEAVVSVDGHSPLPLENGDQVSVQSSDLTVHFVRFEDPGYFYRNITAYMEQNPSTGARS
ncbi:MULTISPECIES: NAD(+)/NADH kinase [Anaerolinea]|uniref:NAD kinase n=1 Tax=Anaerolinea thermophila (strain DSM 14523 / JCM 11388 / NBRC 100420 / UNI-1) TaxID=926569 RepID=E8MYE0_ANATU|nr:MULTISPECIES: NAD(+)/NADH kinase [Anaerolinea]BAJ62085.1 putative inorganic polyphosphate/ATP-NAD kinase [Anaerolinea thermophila UNI-1]